MPNLSLIASDIDLAGAEIELVAVDRREFRLKTALADLPEFKRFRSSCSIVRRAWAY